MLIIGFFALLGEDISDDLVQKSVDPIGAILHQFEYDAGFEAKVS